MEAYSDRSSEYIHTRVIYYLNIVMKHPCQDWMDYIPSIASVLRLMGSSRLNLSPELHLLVTDLKLPAA